MFDLSFTKLLVLAVIALVVFGPKELPKIAAQAGRALRDLRRIAEGAKADLKEGLGPEFQDFDFDDLNPRRFVQKHLLDEPVTAAAQAGVAGTSAAANGAGMAANGAAANGAGATSAVLEDGADPPFDIEAT
ncbi:MAG TPA: sec-independent translocase [Trebonia sp.]|nr:sec-independent translocase [Trebonia sp.]